MLILQTLLDARERLGVVDEDAQACAGLRRRFIQTLHAQDLKFEVVAVPPGGDVEDDRLAGL